MPHPAHSATDPLGCWRHSARCVLPMAPKTETDWDRCGDHGGQASSPQMIQRTVPWRRWQIQ